MTDGRPSEAGRTARWALVWGLTLLGCGATQHRFPLADPIWVDEDMETFARRPSEIYTPPQWDRIDHTLFRRVSEVFLYELDRPALNVNALDEVPDSSWFVNRIGRGRVSPAQIRAGACDSPEEPPRPWTVIRAKESGSSPGLVIRDANGQTSIFKIDFGQPERATASDSISTRIFWAAGYYTPCNRVVFFTPDDLVLATEPDGDHALPSAEDVRRVVDAAMRMPDGTLRGSVSEYIPGRPLGGWRFEGLRDDDPNDVFPHEHRREVRGMYVLSAWLNHIDTRAENNMDGWMQGDDGRGYIRHFVLDAGDSFGQIFETSYLLSQSFGLSHYLDLGHLSEDFLTFGAIDRDYYDAPRGPAFDVLGFYDAERFDPSDWRNGYPNPAFDRATEQDKAWMARIIARFDRLHLRAAVDAGRFSNEVVRQELIRILRARRVSILERYLTRLSPLTDAEVSDGMLCLHDLGLESGLRPSRGRRHRAAAWDDWPREGTRRVRTMRAGSRVCLELPDDERATAEEPRYLVVDVTAGTAGRETTGVARVHLYQVGPGAFRLVGLERPMP
ncbi:MAG: hypothetical protein H6719_30340 [Sandaracinaceae bacterium]|nr:hypothetical protein [Sandaracinaceae bacterium]